MAPENEIKIAIAGGGIAGLVLAAGLHKKHPHIDYHIYEAVPKYKDVGAGLALPRESVDFGSALELTRKSGSAASLDLPTGRTGAEFAGAPTGWFPRPPLKLCL